MKINKSKNGRVAKGTMSDKREGKFYPTAVALYTVLRAMQIQGVKYFDENFTPETVESVMKELELTASPMILSAITNSVPKESAYHTLFTSVVVRQQAFAAYSMGIKN